MPGINANLSQAAFDIWDRVPIKSRRSSGGVRGNPGRSAWLSSVIIEHAGWTERYRELLNEKIDLEKALRVWEKAYGDS